MNCTYTDIRGISSLTNLRCRTVSEILCMLLSPFFSVLFIKTRISPNTVTIFMILSGVLGAFLYAMDSPVTKIIGIICFYLWFIFDCSDGEVARYTKHFSKYGKEMDYMAHLICHPLVILAIWYTYRQMDIDCMDIVSLICISFVSIELINRMFVLFDSYLLSKDKGIESSSSLPSFWKYILIQFLYFPNFVLFFPLLLLWDYTIGFPSFTVYLCWFLFYACYRVFALIKLLVFFYRS